MTNEEQKADSRRVPFPVHRDPESYGSYNEYLRSVGKVPCPDCCGEQWCAISSRCPSCGDEGTAPTVTDHDHDEDDCPDCRAVYHDGYSDGFSAGFAARARPAPTVTKSYEEPTHRTFAYGQQHYDGDACRNCQWQGPPRSGETMPPPKRWQKPVPVRRTVMDDNRRSTTGREKADSCPLKAATEPGFGIQCDLNEGHEGDHYDEMYELYWMGAFERGPAEVTCAGCGADLGHNWHIYEDKNLCDPCFVRRAHQSLPTEGDTDG